MTQLKWWMRIVGGFYILLAIQSLPPIVAARLNAQYVGLDTAVSSVAGQALVDMWFLFGTEIGIVGAMLIYASRAPLKNQILVLTVLVLEAVRGVAMDLYWVTRPIYPTGFYIGFAAVHVIIIVLGVTYLRKARAQPAELQPRIAARASR
jgi:hypothetical protein